MLRRSADRLSPLQEMADFSIRMLYEFYSNQKTKNSDSINATYLLNGVPVASREYRVNGHQQEGEDTHMESSPHLSSSTPHQDEQDVAVPSKNVVLAKEEDLEGEMSMAFMGYVYSKGGVSGEGEIQTNTLNTYL